MNEVEFILNASKLMLSEEIYSVNSLWRTAQAAVATPESKQVAANPTFSSATYKKFVALLPEIDVDYINSGNKNSLFSIGDRVVNKEDSIGTIVKLSKSGLMASVKLDDYGDMTLQYHIGDLKLA